MTLRFKKTWLQSKTNMAVSTFPVKCHTKYISAFALGFSEMHWKTQRGRKNAYDDIKMRITPKQKCGRTFHGMRVS